jgi:sterol desaturase/sphingolipid hydroxylase (fatty acid hydroxylase superfamily)
MIKIWFLYNVYYFTFSIIIDHFFCDERKKEQEIETGYLYLKAVSEAFYNLNVVFPISLFIFSSIKDMDDSPASFLDLFIYISFYTIVFDIWFDIIHRLFHTNPMLYAFHSVHHTYDESFAMAALAMHPLEYTLIIVFGQFLGPLILAPKSSDILDVYLMFTVLANCLAHNKYSSKFIGYNKHIMHHRNPMSNFSAIGITKLVTKLINK